MSTIENEENDENFNEKEDYLIDEENDRKFVTKKNHEFSEHTEILYNLLTLYPDGISCAALTKKYMQYRRQFKLCMSNSSFSCQFF